jgi:TAG lipase/steryl ester hydrolase/phospholipase A2/LPA acyltransferase
MGAKFEICWSPWRALAGLAAKVQRAVLRDGFLDEQLADTTKAERRQILALRMGKAETIEHWEAAAKELDVLEGNEAWKFDDAFECFDSPIIQARLAQLDEARENCDIKQILLQVRTALSRDLGGMDNIKLYKHSHFGTKDLIERYVDSALDTIRGLVATINGVMPDGIEPKDILEQVMYTRQAFGKTALLLSGGATFGMSHVGVIKTLLGAKLLPQIISGASAGSIVSAVVCTRTDEEFLQNLKTVQCGDLAVFEEDGREGCTLSRVRRLLTEGVLFDTKHLIKALEGLLGNITFREAYNRTHRILNISVSPASIYELPRLLNYITSPDVLIWSAVAASCSFPVLFSAAPLLVKSPFTGAITPFNPTPQRWIDGSVENDLPMTRLAEMFNVNHFIVSQVNPYVVPFLAKHDSTCVTNAPRGGISAPAWLCTVIDLAKGEALNRMHMLAELGISPNIITKARSVLSQKYTGDITILPEIPYEEVSRLLKNPTAEFMNQTCLRGEQATWPELSRIRTCCAVELELDSAVQTLRTRVLFQPTQDIKTRDDREVLMSYHKKRKKRITTSSRSSSTPPPPQGIGKAR